MRYKRRYKSDAMQNAYMNACDCLCFGHGKDSWNSCGIDDAHKDMVWNTAVNDMQN